MIIKDVSFIVIARNESFAIEKCLASIASMPLNGCEVICVDSDSTDNTQEVMKGYIGRIDNLRIVHCSGYVNAAVARNAGMRYATKQYIFFVDGDVELYPDFIFEALNRIQSGRADAVTGKLLEIQCTSDYQKEIRRVERRKYMIREKTCIMTGGIFVASRELVERVGEWDSNFWRLQDFDYTLRISQVGTLLQLPQFIGIHHTQEFHDRAWEHFWKGYPLLYGRLLRKNLCVPKFAIMLLRGNRGFTTFLLFGMLIVAALFAAGLSFLPISYVGLMAIICLSIDFAYSTIIKNCKINQWLLHNYLEPPMSLFGTIQRSKQHEGQAKLNVIV